MKSFLNYIADGYRQYEREYSDMAFNAMSEGGMGNNKKIARQISDLDNRKEEEIILYGDIRVVARVTRSQKGIYLVGRVGEKGVSHTTPMSAAIAVGKLAMKNEIVVDEGTKVGKRQVPVYVAVKNKKGWVTHYKVIGHVSQSASSVGAAKVGKKFGAKAAKRVEGLKSDKLPEGPGWVVKSQSGPTGKEVSVNEADSKYIVEKNPNDGKWYVMGHVGRNKWMPVSN